MKKLSYLQSLDVMLSCDMYALSDLGVWSYLESECGVSFANKVRHSLEDHVFHAQLALNQLDKITSKKK